MTAGAHDLEALAADCDECTGLASATCAACAVSYLLAGDEPPTGTPVRFRPLEGHRP